MTDEPREPDQPDTPAPSEPTDGGLPAIESVGDMSGKLTVLPGDDVVPVKHPLTEEERNDIVARIRVSSDEKERRELESQLVHETHNLPESGDQPQQSTEATE